MARPKTNPPTPAELRIAEIIKDNDLDGVSGLSNAIGVPADTIRKWGQRNSIPKDAAARIAARYGYEVVWVLTGQGSRRQQAGMANIATAAPSATPQAVPVADTRSSMIRDFAAIDNDTYRQAVKVVRGILSLTGNTDRDLETKAIAYYYHEMMKGKV